MPDGPAQSCTATARLNPMLYRDLLLVAGALMIWGIGEGMFLFFQPLYLQQLGADPLQIGGILGLTSAFMTAVHLPAGYLSDRIGRRPMMLAAWFTATAATWWMAMAKTLPIFVVGSILYSMTIFVAVPMNSYLTTARGNLSVGRALTLVSAFYNMGAILGPIIGGWIGSRLGLQRNFFIAGIIFLFSTALICLIRPQPIEPAFKTREQKRIQQVLTPTFLRFLFIAFLVMFMLYLPQPLTVNYLQNERGLGLNQIGQLISLRSLGVVFLSLTLGQFNARTGFLTSQIAVCAFAGLIWKSVSFPGYAIGYLLGGGFQTARSFIAAQGRALMEADTMGVGYGMIETTVSTAIVLAPLLAGFLYSLRPESVYITSLVGMALTLLTSFFFLPKGRGG